MRHPASLLGALLVSAVLLFAPTAARAADPLARATVDAQGTIYPGQQVTVTVDVLVPNFFMSPPQFPLFDLPNAVVTLPDSGAQNLNETIDGESYAGIRRSYLVTPQAAGDYVLPPVEITFTYAAVPGQASPGKVTLPSTKFTVTGQPGADSGGGSVTAARVEVEQALDRDVNGIRAGDSLVRTVTVTADGMQAMMIPEPPFEAPDGVRIYRHDPKLEDEKTPRGEFVAGQRIDAVTYVFEKAGSYALPAVEVHWFDPKSGQSETASAPAISVTVAEAAASGPAIVPPVPTEAPQPAWTHIDWRRWLPVAGVAVVALAAVGWFLVGGLPRLLAHSRVRRHERENSEPAYFLRFEQACRGGDARTAWARLDEWARNSRIGPMRDWLSRFGDSESLRTYDGLTKSLFGHVAQDHPVDYFKLSKSFATARTNWLDQNNTLSVPKTALPALNPAFGDDHGPKAVESSGM